MIITTSWDDGYPADVRIAELLAKLGLAGTFYVPHRNIEGRAVMDASSLRVISRKFEIGGHTLDHTDLTFVLSAEAERQIRQGKTRLEDTIGKEIDGFCYPRGHYNCAIKRLVMEAGFTYARNIKNFCSGVGTDLFEVPVTLQFFPHSRYVYARNLAKCPSLERSHLFLAAARATNIVERVRRVFDLCQTRNAEVFHLWGHSWEIERHDLWADLETSLKYVRGALNAKFATNREAIERAINGDLSG